MKLKFLVFFMLIGVLSFSEVKDESFISKFQMSMGAGYTSTKDDGGFAFLMKTITYFGDTDYYFGFTNLSATLNNSETAMFESGFNVGLINDKLIRNIGLGVSLEINGGGTVSKNNIFETSGIGLAPSFEIAFPYSKKTDASLNFTPLFKYKDSEFKYHSITVSIMCNLKSRTRSVLLPWNKK